MTATTTDVTNLKSQIYQPHLTEAESKLHQRALAISAPSDLARTFAWVTLGEIFLNTIPKLVRIPEVPSGLMATYKNHALTQACTKYQGLFLAHELCGTGNNNLLAQLFEAALNPQSSADPVEPKNRKTDLQVTMQLQWNLVADTFAKVAMKEITLYRMTAKSDEGATTIIYPWHLWGRSLIEQRGLIAQEEQYLAAACKNPWIAHAERHKQASDAIMTHVSESGIAACILEYSHGIPDFFESAMLKEKLVQKLGCTATELAQRIHYPVIPITESTQLTVASRQTLVAQRIEAYFEFTLIHLMIITYVANHRLVSQTQSLSEVVENDLDKIAKAALTSATTLDVLSSNSVELSNNLDYAQLDVRTRILACFTHRANLADPEHSFRYHTDAQSLPTQIYIGTLLANERPYNQDKIMQSLILNGPVTQWHQPAEVEDDKCKVRLKEVNNEPN